MVERRAHPRGDCPGAHAVCPGTHGGPALVAPDVAGRGCGPVRRHLDGQRHAHHGGRPAHSLDQTPAHESDRWDGSRAGGGESPAAHASALAGVEESRVSRIYAVVYTGTITAAGGDTD